MTIKSKVLIVGCTGRLGSELLKVLQDPFDLDVCLRLNPAQNLPETGLIFCEQSKKSFRLDDYEVVINCAWVVGVSSKCLNENILISKLLLRGTKRGSYVYFSTIDVYGDNQINGDRCAPRTVFAFNKLRTELAIHETETSRAKVVLRVGHFISAEQIAVDSMSPVFESHVDRSKQANLVNLVTLSLQIESIVKDPPKLGQTSVLNCVDEPNRKWGDVIDSVTSSRIVDIRPSLVSVLNSKGPYPVVFKYLKKGGVVLTEVSFVTLRVFISRILSPLVAPPVLRGPRQPRSVEHDRVYQDYTLRVCLNKPPIIICAK